MLFKSLLKKQNRTLEKQIHDFQNLNRSIIGWKKIFQKVEDRKYEE